MTYRTSEHYPDLNAAVNELSLNLAALTTERDSLLVNYLPVDDGALYIAIEGHASHHVTEYNNGARSYYITRGPDGVFTDSDDVPDTLILKPNHFPSIPDDKEDGAGEKVAFNFFNDAAGNFALQFRGADGSDKRVEIWLQDVPYSEIPNLNLPNGWTYATGQNPGTSGFNHLFNGEISGFANVNISGGKTNNRNIRFF